MSAQQSKTRIEKTGWLKIQRLQQEPANIQLNQVNDDILRITGIPQILLDGLDDERAISVRHVPHAACFNVKMSLLVLL